MDHEPLIAPRLLAIMQCPACTGALHERPEPPALVCDDCSMAYAVTDGVPNMIVAEAETPLGE
ncbi:MAG: Trm112 family protein [Acidimicrobiia bacterium]